MLKKYSNYLDGMMDASNEHYGSDEVKLGSLKSHLIAKAFRGSRMGKLRQAIAGYKMKNHLKTTTKGVVKD